MSSMHVPNATDTRYNAIHILWLFTQKSVNGALCLCKCATTILEQPLTDRAAFHSAYNVAIPMRVWHWLIETETHIEQIMRVINAIETHTVFKYPKYLRTCHLARFCLDIHRQCTGHMSPYTDVIRATGALIAIVQRYPTEVWDFIWENIHVLHMKNSTQLWTILATHTKEKQHIYCLQVYLMRKKYKGDSIVPQITEDVAKLIGIQIEKNYPSATGDLLEFNDNDNLLVLPREMTLHSAYEQTKEINDNGHNMLNANTDTSQSIHTENLNIQPIVAYNETLSASKTHSPLNTGSTMHNIESETNILKAILECLHTVHMSIDA